MMVFLKQHSLILLLTAASVFTFFWLYWQRQRLGMEPYAVLIVTILHVLYGVFTVRLFAAMEGSPGGMSLFGAVFLMPAAYYAGARITRRPIAEVFDILTICMVFTLLCARVNCLISGCCLGRQISSHTEARWPTRESELVFYIIFLIAAIPRVREGKTKGNVYPVYMAAYGAFRAVNECFRQSAASNSIFHLSHLWAVLTLCLGLSFLMEMRKRTGTENHPKRKTRHKGAEK